MEREDRERAEAQAERQHFHQASISTPTVSLGNTSREVVEELLANYEGTPESK